MLIDTGSAGRRTTKNDAAGRWTDHASDLIAAVLANAGDLHAAVIEEVAGAVQQTVEAAIADLEPTQRQKLRDRLGRHLICGVLVMVVQALEPFADADQQIAEALTQPAHPHNDDLPEMIVIKLVRETISRLIQSVGHTALIQAKAALRLLRICAIAACPDPDHHPEITRHCIAALTGEAVNAATVSQLTRVQLSPITG